MIRSLRSCPLISTHVLITGATGYVGTLVAATLLQHTSVHLHCLTRAHHGREALLEGLWEECQAQGANLSRAEFEARITHHLMPERVSDLPNLHAQWAKVDEIIHCAGSVDYYDEAALDAVNIAFTAHLIELARRLPLQRLVFISTAFSSGYQDHATPEHALDEPARDPTYYTRSKRRAEQLVAESGLPFLVLRPSILIGTHTTGRYSGKRYGLYQHWMGLERLTCDRYHPEFHAVAQTQPVNVLHQDAFCAAFAAARAWLPDGAYCNMVSDAAHCPSMRDIWEMWFAVTQPAKVYYYPSIEAVALRTLHPRQRAYITFAQINLEIAAHPWRFETGWLDQLRSQGLVFANATLESVRRCQDRFIASSDVMSRYLNQWGRPPAQPMQVMDRPSHPSPHDVRGVA